MTNSAALSGDYVDLRFIKSRKVCQVIIEIPIEQGSAFVQAFGTPNPATGVPVAIARLQETAKQQEKPKRSWSDIPRSQQAAMKCDDPDFRAFLTERMDYHVGDASAAAKTIRMICAVQSRADIDASERASKAWDSLYSDYQLYQRGAAA